MEFGLTFYLILLEICKKSTCIISHHSDKHSHSVFLLNQDFVFLFQIAMTSNRYEIDNELYITNLLTEDDIPSLIKYLNNPTLYANTLRIPSPYTTNDAEDFIQRIKSDSSESKRFFTIRLSSTDELIGACGLYRLGDNKKKIEIGYWLGEPYWGRGIMPKVINKTLEIIKNEWKDFIRIEARVFPWNKGSRRVLEKCGFTFEGLLRKHVYKNGQDIDVDLYALIIE
jgi:ribosomal-protein-alanine N-acetyltransferase